MKKVLFGMMFVVASLGAKAQAPTLHVINSNFPSGTVDFLFYGNNDPTVTCTNTYVVPRYGAGAFFSNDFYAPTVTTWTTTPTPPATQFTHVRFFYTPPPPAAMEYLDVSLCGATNTTYSTMFSGGTPTNVVIAVGTSDISVNLTP